MPKDKKEKYFILFCIFCILCGVVFRFVTIFMPLSYDELFTIVTSDRAFSLSYIIKEFLIPDVHPPLYNIIMHFWFIIFPSFSEAVIRIPSLVFSLAALFCGWFYYPKGRDLAEKYIFTAFLSVSTIIVYSGVRARSYSLVLLLSVLLNFLTLRMAEKILKGVTPSKKDFALYFILTLVATYTHYVGAITAGAQTLVLLGYAFYKKRGFWQIAALYFIVLVLIAPWMYLQIPANAGNLNGMWWNTSTFWGRSITNVLTAFTTGEIAGLFIWMSVLYALLVMARKDKKVLSGVFMLFPVFTLMISVGVMLAVISKINLFIGRLFMPLFPPAFLIFAFFMNYAAKQRKVFMLVNAAALCTMAGISAYSFTMWDYVGGGVSKDAARFLIEKYPQTQNELFFESGGEKTDPLVVAYYFRALTGKPPAKIYNIATPEGAAAFHNARGVTPLLITDCAYITAAKEVVAVFGMNCIGVYDK